MYELVLNDTQNNVRYIRKLKALDYILFVVLHRTDCWNV